ncbi:basic amino acid/polyamine antiporter [Dongshaea marina]|uniref:basic amino acid/polyamine antiporter n=1 Tax=Dongshaea marina TaxID=2047966 RepID=UPI000D3E45CA|nr:basic amino acid/polyamine antiporter [Dongshaea marina]
MDKKLGLGALICLIIGSMVGAGVFSLPQNIADQAAPGAVAIGWLITGVGMLCLALVYQNLSIRRPDLDGGIFTYAQAGFGDFVGFNAAWGYWICQMLANVSYVVVVFSAISYFTDSPGHVLFGDGNTLPAIVAGSVLMWALTLLVLRGIHVAAMVNIVTTIAKLIPLIVFCIAVILASHLKEFSFDFWGSQTPGLGSVMDQVKTTMKVTLWVFIGIEGAVVVSGRARKRTDVGKATIIAFTGAIAIYIMVTLFSFGVMSQPEIAQLKNPSTALILQKIVGPWGAILINIGLVISVLGALLSWITLTAEVPYIAGKQGLFPRCFQRENGNRAPTVSLILSSCLVQLFLIIVLFKNSSYLALVNITTSAALVPYVFSGAYGLKLVLSGETYDKDSARRRRAHLLIAGIATFYGVWLVYAAGIEYLLLATLMYFPGVLVYMWSNKEHGQRKLKMVEKVISVALFGFAIIALRMVLNGQISLT